MSTPGHRRRKPRLVSGLARVPCFLNLPPVVREGLGHIAEEEDRTESWIIEDIVLEFFGLRRLHATKADVALKLPKPKPPSKGSRS